MDFQIVETKRFASGALKELFDSVGWEGHASGHELAEAMEKSANVIGAFVGDRLVGLIRDLDDGVYKANIDLLVVHKDYQHNGIGTALVRALLSKLQSMCHITVAVTEPDNIPFYQRFGFEVVNGGVLQINKQPIQTTGSWQAYTGKLYQKFTKVT